MAESRHFIRALRELETELENETLPVASRSRISRAIADRGEPRSSFAVRWLPAATFAAGAALAIVAVASQAGSLSSDVEEVVEPTRPMLGSFAIEGDGCRATDAPFGTTLEGECRLVSERVVIQTWDHASLAADDRYVRVLEGDVVFDVTRVPVGEASVKIAVSHGVIEVVGTRFVIEQRKDGGYVDLFEGKIVFYGYAGDVTSVNPGQRHRWGDDTDPQIVVVVEDEDTSGSVAKKPKAARNMDATAVIERVNELRAQGRYQKAVKVLRQALRRRWDRRTSQVLSYELGELLHRHIGDRGSACAHLKRHQAKYPRGRYDDAIARTLAKLSCD